MTESWSITRPPRITCCHHCPNRIVTEHYNCHDHCETYLKQSKRNREEQKALTEAIIKQQKSDNHYTQQIMCMGGGRVKTADEMFRDQGYKGTLYDGGIEYGNDVYDSIFFNGKFVTFGLPGLDDISIENNVILACAQLIREMEDEEKKHKFTDDFEDQDGVLGLTTDSY